MRIRKISIANWRHFADIELVLEDSAGLVCIVGANGTGKSHLLELIAACAHRLGLAQGVEIPRGDPFNDPHKFSLEFYLAQGVITTIDEGLATDPSYAAWDHTLTISSEKRPEHANVRVEAGGIADANRRVTFAQAIVGRLQSSKDVYFLSLDADRAYPDRKINANQIAEAYEIDWEGLEYTRGRSFRTTMTLYDEWKKYFLARENQTATAHAKEIRKARQANAPEPRFVDHLESYRDALQKVLPHVVFTGWTRRVATCCLTQRALSSTSTS